MLVNREIVVAAGPAGPAPEAVFDLSETQIEAVDAAVAHYRRTRFAGSTLDARQALALRELAPLADALDELAAAGGHAVVRVGPDGAAALVRASRAYLRERDTEGYQSPEERDRLAALGPLVDPLIDLEEELRGAARRLAADSN
jgi:hypothetical protein